MTGTAQQALEQIADNILELDPDKWGNDVERLGIEWADKDETARLLEKTEKTLHAQLMLEYMKSGSGEGKKPMSVALAEVMAYADPRFETHLQGMTAAKGDANRAKVRYDRMRDQAELMRTVAATKREEMRLGGVRK